MAVIATNTAANTSLVYLNRNAAEQGDSLAKISSGSRIVKASDDAAGLAVGTGLKADAAVLKQAAINAQQSVAILSIADGGLSQIGDILERAKVLAAQSASGTVTNTERGYINTEYQALINEVNAIETAVTFNGDALLDGAFNFNVLVGANAADVIAINLTTVNVDSTNIGTGAGGAGGDDLVNALVTTNANAILALGIVESASGDIVSMRATVGALQSRFGFRNEVIAVSVDNTEDAVSSIMDVDIAAEQTNLTNKRVLTEAAIVGLSQANELTQSLLTLLR